MKINKKNLDIFKIIFPNSIINKYWDTESWNTIDKFITNKENYQEKDIESITKSSTMESPWHRWPPEYYIIKSMTSVERLNSINLSSVTTTRQSLVILKNNSDPPFL